MSRNKTILEVDNLKVYFPLLSGFVKKIIGHVRAVDGVSINMKENQEIILEHNFHHQFK